MMKAFDHLTEFVWSLDELEHYNENELLTLAYKIAKLDKEIGKLCDALPGIATNQYSKKCLNFLKKGIDFIENFAIIG